MEPRLAPPPAPGQEPEALAYPAGVDGGVDPHPVTPAPAQPPRVARLRGQLRRRIGNARSLAKALQRLDRPWVEPPTRLALRPASQGQHDAQSRIHLAERSGAGVPVEPAEVAVGTKA